MKQFPEKFIHTDSHTTIAYTDLGSGQPLILVPGWCMFKEIFYQQIEFFAKTHRVIALDPRGQAHSSKSIMDLSYGAQARDLFTLIQELNLKDCIVLGWSYGCLSLYSYIQQFGINNIAAFIFTDLGPVPRAHANFKWGWENEAMCNLFQPLIYDFPNMLKDVWQFHSFNLSEEEFAWIMERTLETPSYIAALYSAESLSANYEAEAKFIDGKLPVLNIVQRNFKEVAFAWLAENTPHAAKEALGSHMMFLEQPEKFNRIVENFLLASHLELQ